MTFIARWRFYVAGASLAIAQTLTKRMMRIVVVAAGFIALGFGQIPQQKPELCGRKGTIVPLPPKVSASVEATQVFSTLSLVPSGGDAPVRLPLPAAKVDEVCDIPGNRLLVFGDTIPGAYLTAIVDANTGSLVDSFNSYNPMASPNQHWIVFRDFYPPQSELRFSEEYLLYDLTKDKEANRISNSDPYVADTPGRVIYPVVDGRATFEHSGLPISQAHRFRSNSFYWAADSRAVVFADSVQGRLSIILITIDGDRLSTYVHPVSAADACEQSSRANIEDADLMLSQVDLSGAADERTGDLMFRSSDSGACRPKGITLHFEDFRPAQVESHEAPKRRERSVLKQQ